MPAALLAPRLDPAPALRTRSRPQPTVAPAPDERARLLGVLRSADETASAATLAERIRRVQALDAKERPGRPARMAIAEAIVRLREVKTATALIDAAPAELCGAGGFSRAMVSRVRNGAWIPEVFHPLAGPLTADFARHQGTEIPLRVMALETELARRRVPLLVSSPQTDQRVSDAFLRAARCGSYAVAPILSAGRVIGFFHADRLGQDGEVDAVDRDTAATFADHFGMLFERLTILARLTRQTAELEARLKGVAAVAGDLCRGVDVPSASGVSAVTVGRRGRAIPATIDLLLTAREIEVLELIVSGATNRQIASGLTVTEGTVKSHVKRIHQKLHVHNRSQAAAWYLRQQRRT